jgi:hypothetical protein
VRLWKKPVLLRPFMLCIIIVYSIRRQAIGSSIYLWSEDASNCDLINPIFPLKYLTLDLYCPSPTETVVGIDVYLYNK